jgi:Tfp pilus assembly protein PilF
MVEGAPESPHVVGLGDVEILEDDAPHPALLRGVDAWIAGDRARARASLEEAAREDPAAAEAHYFLAKALGDDRAAARAALERAVSLDPGRFAAWRALALCCRAMGDGAAAAAAARRAAELAPDPAARAALARDLASA